MCRAANQRKVTEVFRRLAAQEERRVQRGVAHLLGLAVVFDADEPLGPRLTENNKTHDLFREPDGRDSAPPRQS